ncbi:MAG: hypothetical protein ORO03_05710 [Alphaproteobacteria bacterium]|nr:hypothetical protein [Alphaproteobacteria bacterium]
MRELRSKIAFTITVVLVLGLALLPVPTLANEECGINADGDSYGKGDIKGQAQFSNQKRTLTQYGFSFWAENIGAYANNRGVNTVMIHAGNGSTHRLTGWCLEAKVSSGGTFDVKLNEVEEPIRFPILSDRLGPAIRPPP